MPDPAPLSLTESAVADWLYDVGADPTNEDAPTETLQARAVLALVEDRVRAALTEASDAPGCYTFDQIVSRVLGRPA